MLTRRALLITATATPIVGIASMALAGKPPVYMNRGIAIDGTDAVAYFTDSKPVRGSDAHTFDWKGATWRFSSAANRDAFAATPDAYAPQFGGYCAWAVSEGYTASTVPEAWKIVDGKLYLNFSRRIQRRWEQQLEMRIAAGHRNWPSVLG